MPYQHLHPAEKLKRIREDLGVSQREFAKELGVTNGAVAHWESGVRPIPGPVLKVLELYEQSLQSQGHSNTDINRSEHYKVFQKEISALGLQNHAEQLHGYAKSTWDKNQISGRFKIAALNKLIHSLKKSKGISIKVAQLASFLELGLPVEVRSALGNLQATLKPTPRQEIIKLIQEEYGKPLKEIFSFWDPTPLAVTSLGQVHRAKLVSGQDVAVKVQHPEILQMLTKQFGQIEFIHNLANMINRGNDEIMTEIRQTIVKECDYYREARNQEKFRNIFLGKKNIIIPQVHHDLTRSRVLVTEYIRGENFYSFIAKANQQKKNQAAQVILETLTHATFSLNFTHGDLHPGNFLFVDDSVVFLDFGRMIDLPEERMNLEIDMYLALLDKNYDKTKELSLKLFAKDPDTFEFDEFWDFLINSSEHLLTDEPFKFTRDYVSQIARESRRFTAKNQLRLSPEAFWAFVFSASSWALFAELEAECPWRKLAFNAFLKKPLN